MRTQPSNILNACPYCNNNHDPANRCRELPESPRFHLNERRQPKKRVVPVTDATGKVIGSKTEWS